MNTHHWCIIQQSLSTVQYGMFYGATSFNQNIDNWVISKGITFVSILFICNDADLIWHNTWILIIDISCNNQYLYFRLLCFPWQPHLTKILATEMFLRVKTLWVFFWPVKNLIVFDIYMDTHHWCRIQQSVFIIQHGMFYRATNFNQSISNWDVSKGTRFVSICLICKELNLMWHNPWILIIDVSSINQYLHFRFICLALQLHSTKISTTGIFLRVQTLWVILWHVKNLISFGIIHEYSSLMYHPTIIVHTSVLYVLWVIYLRTKSKCMIEMGHKS